MAGKPRYKTPEEMQSVIDQYFIDCEGRYLRDNEGEFILDKYGRPILVDAKPPTVTGLALALGFTTRQALINYQGRKAFIDTVTRAKSRIEAYAEGRLFDRDGQRGAEFSLRCNFKWQDKSVVEIGEISAKDDGFLSALKSETKKVWSDGASTDAPPGDISVSAIQQSAETAVDLVDGGQPGV